MFQKPSSSLTEGTVSSDCWFSNFHYNSCD